VVGWLAAVITVGGLTYLLVWYVPDTLARRHADASVESAWISAVAITLGVVATAAVAVAAFWYSRSTNQATIDAAKDSTDKTLDAAREAQFPDRYSKAIEQLGSDNMDVRLGGIYALEGIAVDSARHHPTVMEVLAAFIREHSREQWPVPGSDDAAVPERTTRPDVQAALTVIGRRDAARDRRRIDLHGADLIRANLTRANLTRANLDHANLTGAILTGANLTDTFLAGANLTRANLDHAFLAGANLIRAILTGANLARAMLTGAKLTRANLTDANLTSAFLGGAPLTLANLARAFLDADFTRVYLTRANLDDAVLTRANLTRANLTGANLTRAFLVGAILPSDRLGGANLTGANLTRANLTHANLTGAILSATNLADTELADARFSEAMPVPEGWVRDAGTGRLKRSDERQKGQPSAG